MGLATNYGFKVIINDAVVTTDDVDVLCLRCTDHHSWVVTINGHIYKWKRVTRYELHIASSHRITTLVRESRAEVMYFKKNKQEELPLTGTKPTAIFLI